MEPSPTRTSPPQDAQRYPFPDYEARAEKSKDRYWLHLLLFVLTLASTIWTGGTMAGRVLLYGTTSASELLTNTTFLLDGLRYAFSLLLFLTVHEFGHYSAARYHRIDTSLPYYIPLPISIIGTLGAVIRIREPIPSRRKLFDIGAAGPLAGFVIALGLLLYALITLPGPEYLLTQEGHEAIKTYIEQYGRFPDQMLEKPDPSSGSIVIVFGQTPLFWLLSQLFPNVPPMYEILHYPVLIAAWFALFFTALNLLPVGQLDGGHIIYALVGRRWHGRIARAFMLLLLLSGSIGFMDEVVPWLYETHELLGQGAWFVLAAILYFFLGRVFQGIHRYIAPALFGLIGLTVLAELIGAAATSFGYWPWFLWCLLIIFFIRIEHPPVMRHEPLTPTHWALGILAILIFILCFSFRPIHVL